MRNYRTAFLVGLIANLLLAALVFGLWRRYRAAEKSAAGPPPQAAATSGAGAASASPKPAAPPPAEAPLVPVQLSPQRLQSIGVRFAEVERKPVHDEIRAAGNVAMDETRLAYVQVRFSGWIQKVFADATYQYIRKGQPLFTIYSPELVTTEREYLLARKNQQALASSAVPGVAASSASLLDAAAERLKQWGVPDREIQNLEATGQVRRELEIDSPVSGYVIERAALPNLYAQPETRLYTVADLSTVWVFAQVFQNELGRLRVSDPARLTLDAYPDRTFPGRVDFIYPEVDMATRTARVRLIFPNPGLLLKPGMFVNVALQIPLGKQLVIPSTGVFQSGTRAIAFVDRGGGYLEPREVELGARAGDQFVVRKGLQAGERIVTSANFLIDSESQLQAALGSFVPPPPGAGAAAAMSQPQATLELTTDPAPPRKGSNTFRAALKDADGNPVSGAQVTITFFMPAMPQMGMAAVRAEFPLAEKGEGIYEGRGNLPAGGTWQVTIVARRNGQTVAAKQLTLDVTGGM